jgi:hypothetical protein
MLPFINFSGIIVPYVKYGVIGVYNRHLQQYLSSIATSKRIGEEKPRQL